MAKPEDTTPLMALLRAFENEAEHAEFAAEAGTTSNYLYALAGCHRGQPKVGLALAIEDASVKFHVKTNGRIPLITVRDLATMCSTVGFCDT